MEKLEGMIYYIHDGKKVLGRTESHDTDNSNIIGLIKALDEDCVKNGYCLIENDDGINWNVKFSDKGIALTSLKKTDWIMARHRDELELEGETSMSDEDYKKVLKKREEWRKVLNSTE